MHINHCKNYSFASLCQQYLVWLYKNISIPTSLSNTANLTETQGEILPQSITKLLSEISPTDHDIFIDLGSGKGKVVLQVFLESTAKKVIGIELVPQLHAIATFAEKRMRGDLPDLYFNHREMELIEGNFLTVPFTTATIALVCSTCFSPSLLNNLGQILNDTLSIHTILSLRPIYSLKRLPFVKTLRVECSWDTALCYLYSSRLTK